MKLEESRAIDETITRIGFADISDEELEEELRQLQLHQETPPSVSVEEISLPDVPTQVIDLDKNLQSDLKKLADLPL